MKKWIYVASMTALAIPIVGFVWFEARSNTGAVNSGPAPAPVVLFAAPLSEPPAPLVSQPQVAPPVDTLGADGAIRHIAQPGETVTSLATDLLGKDTKTNRNAIINANTSLQADPDKLLAGKSYHIPTAVDGPVVQAAPAVAPASVAKPQPVAAETVDVKPQTELKYTAKSGDTVGNLAAAFLGSDDQSHQNTIIGANPSLRADPDRLLAGTTYRIPAQAGLSAAPSATTASLRPTTQPDADQIVAAGSPRTLRYVARAGDSVTTLAIELLGSDTQAARDTIIASNPSLKRDPDNLIAGQTYWIPAPTAPAQNP